MPSPDWNTVTARWLQMPPVYPVDSEPKERTSPHSQPGLEINLTCSGRGTLHVGGESHPLSAGAVVIIPEGVPHVLEAQAGSRYVRSVLCIAPPAGDRRPMMQALTAFLKEKPFQRQRCLYLDGESTREVQATISQIAREWTERDAQWEEVAHARALGLLALLARLAGRKRSTLPPGGQRAEEVAAYIAARLDGDLTTQAVADHFGMSREHLSRLFRHHFGVTYQSYVLARRVDVARRLLAGPCAGASLLEVALAVGFQSHAHFSRVFRKCEGITPSEYRLLRRGV